MKYFAMFLLLFSAVIIGCSSGQYVDPNKKMVTDARFSDSDLSIIANEISDEFLKSPFLQEKTIKPRIAIGSMTNDTAEHIDTKSILNMIKTDIINSGKVTFMGNSHKREILAMERAYQKGEAVNKNLAVAFGNETPPEFLMFGSISAIYKKDGRTNYVYYKFTMQLISVETNEIVWIHESKVKKSYTKRKFIF